VRAGDLVTNPQNWRIHPQHQRDALKGLLAEVGYADALIARELDDGRLMLIDGHLRAETTPDMEVPVLVLDVTDKEAQIILATLDPLAELAEKNDGALIQLVEGICSNNDAVTGLLNSIAGAEEQGEGNALTFFSPEKIPTMAWVLIGIPVLRFGEIAADIERLSKIEGVVSETTINDQTN